MSLLTFVLCLIALVTFLLLFVRKLLTPLVPVKGTTNILGPKGGRRWPIIGDGLWFANIADTKDLWDRVEKLFQSREKIGCLWLGSKLSIWISDAEIAKKLIDSKKCPRKEEEFYSSFSYISDGVFSTTNPSRWPKLRQSLDKFLLPKMMDDHMVVFADKAQVTCDKIQRICGEGVFELKNVIEYYTLDLILHIFLGTPGNQQLEDTMHLTKTIPKVLECAFLRILQPIYRISWIFNSSPLGKETNRMVECLKSPMRKIVNECLKEMEDRGYTRNDPDFEPQNYLEALIDFEIQQNSEEKMDTSIIDLITAGFDTTGVAISATILFLAMHPEYQEKAYQEQLSLMGSSFNAPNRAELSRMEYLEMIFLETLRKVMPPSVLRTVSSEIEIDGYVFPEGATVFFCLNKIANDPQYWENPKSFYPDHFLPEKVAKRPSYAFMPFAFGSRGCPGRRFGMMSSMVVLSMLLRRFRFTTPLQFNQLNYKYMLMVESIDGYPVEATPRPIATI
ncbi:hypothetical protein GE061_017436 [Apolygus lucorum]|uniref:Uncharacterized protein n=1 Tax=Apolygus lucorum TaxID=248454 RepID=A0A6A4J1V8_APOLU|nr:hypothetical protein GE061_017436 [Apolygus lucorum]